jgi:NAD(P)H dehydrogenase (quinone)
MNILIVHAHPEPKSFCSALKDTAKEYFEKNGDTVEISDLYSMGFDAVGSRKDFKDLKDANYFKYQLEQANAFQNGLFSDELKIEMNKLEKADVVIFNFPLWWFTVPAIMKGWIDRVFAMGFVYGSGKKLYDEGVYRNKTGFLCLTTGGPEAAYTEGGSNGDIMKILFPINHGVLYFVGIKAIKPFAVYGPVRLSDEERKKKLDEYKDFLSRIYEEKALF